MLSANEIEKYSFKNILVKVLERMGLERKYATNVILLQDINAFLQDSGFFGYTFEELEHKFMGDKIVENYDKTLEYYYQFLKDKLVIRQDEYSVTVERNFIDCYYLSDKDPVYMSKFEGNLYLRNDSNETISKIAEFMKRMGPSEYLKTSDILLTSRKLCISKINDFVTYEVHVREIGMIFLYNLLGYNNIANNSTRKVEVFNGTNMISTSYYDFYELIERYENEVCFKTPNDKNYTSMTKIISNGNVVDVTYNRIDRNATEQLPEIKFQLDLDYDCWIWEQTYFEMYKEPESCYEPGKYDVISKVFSDEMLGEIYSRIDIKKLESYEKIRKNKLNK